MNACVTQYWCAGMCACFLCNPQSVRAPSAVRCEPLCPSPIGSGLFVFPPALAATDPCAPGTELRAHLYLSLLQLTLPFPLMLWHERSSGADTGLTAKSITGGEKCVYPAWGSLKDIGLSFVSRPLSWGSPGARRPTVPVAPSLNGKRCLLLVLENP